MTKRVVLVHNNHWKYNFAQIAEKQLFNNWRSSKVNSLYNSFSSFLIRRISEIIFSISLSHLPQFSPEPTDQEHLHLWASLWMKGECGLVVTLGPNFHCWRRFWLLDQHVSGCEWSGGLGGSGLSQLGWRVLESTSVKSWNVSWLLISYIQSLAHFQYIWLFFQ